MARPLVSAGGGTSSMLYILRKALETRRPVDFVRRMRARNACKTCAVGMGGQLGGMVNEAGHFPEFCKKSVQAQAGDMGRVIDEAVLARTPISALQRMSSAELERLGRLPFPIVAGPGDTHYRRTSWEDALVRAVEEVERNLDHGLLHPPQAGEGGGTECVLGLVEGVGVLGDLHHVLAGVEDVDGGLLAAPIDVVPTEVGQTLPEVVPVFALLGQSGARFGHGHLRVGPRPRRAVRVTVPWSSSAS